MSESGEIPDGCLPDLPPEMKVCSPIYVVKDELFMDTLVQFLDKANSSEFLNVATKFLKYLQNQFLQKSGYDADKISCMASEVWQLPCFVDCVRFTLDEDHEIIGYALCCSNNDSAVDRVNHMKADRYFEPSLSSTISDTADNATLIRVFLSILFGHWTGEGDLRELDKRMGENHFGLRMDMIARSKLRAKAREGKKFECDLISYVMKSASDVENMEPLRKELVNKYGEGNIDIQAVLDKVKRDLVRCVNIHQNHLGYDGGEARIEITISEGRCCGGIGIISNSSPCSEKPLEDDA